MGCGKAEAHVSDGPTKADWKRAADGIGMAGFAVFLLLNTTGVLPWSFWVEAIALWPLLIMSAGIKIAFEKTRAPWLVLLGPALVLSGLAWVATGARTDVPVGPWKSEGPLPRPEGATRVKLDLKLFGSRLAGDGARARAGGARRRALDRARVERQPLREARGRHRTRSPRRDRGARCRRAAGPPAALGAGRADRAAAQLRPRGCDGPQPLRPAVTAGSRADRRNGVFLATQLTLPSPSASVKLRVNGVFNALRISVPEGTPVRVHGTGFPFNAVKRRVVGAEGRPGYEIDVDGIFNAIDIDTRPADAGRGTPGSPSGRGAAHTARPARARPRIRSTAGRPTAP